ncbi:very low-density lipoprotein receptor-like [Pomacea canaliculata]|uniref:very low-density lipoprotein receptor-like n=1 Tax=Pomacea canaliculata TaxID=400727 RepID=UPI000D7355C7|nr:very low-density lipoprotein receptor-like [Pomacea canaliculata]
MSEEQHDSYLELNRFIRVVPTVSLGVASPLFLDTVPVFTLELRVCTCFEWGKQQDSACADNEFQCKDGFCIQEEWTCDAQHDCWDDSDETLPECTHAGYCTGAHQIRCKNNRCMPLEFRCDGKNDCGDGTDEVDCASFTCSRGEFKCSNGHCIEEIYLCDGDDDCFDKSDEQPSNCPSGKRAV